LSQKLNEGRFALPLFPPFKLDRAQIFDKVTPMDWNPLGFHPPIIGEFLAPHSDYGFLFCGFVLSCFGHKTPFLSVSRFSVSDLKPGIHPTTCCFGGRKRFILVV
jgi:hypothetical protein